MREKQREKQFCQKDLPGEFEVEQQAIRRQCSIMTLF